MTYKRNVSKQIEGIVRDITNLEPGESLRIGSVKKMVSIRWQIYSWMTETGMKHLFTLRVRSPYLLVERKETEFKTQKIKKLNELTEHLDFLLQKALKAPDGNLFLVEEYQSGKLTATEFAEILSAYHETQK